MTREARSDATHSSTHLQQHHYSSRLIPLTRGTGTIGASLCRRKPFLPFAAAGHIPIPQATGRKRAWKKRRYSGS